MIEREDAYYEFCKTRRINFLFRRAKAELGTHLHEDVKRTKGEGHELGSLFHKDTGADTADGAKGELVRGENGLRREIVRGRLSSDRVGWIVVSEMVSQSVTLSTDA